jgi:UDPglucose 6-dehydrogenase
VVGACFAETGNEVICVDRDAGKVRKLNRGGIPIYEPGLEELVRRNRHERRLTFTTNLPDSVRRSQVVFIAVGTPTGEDGSADLKYVLGVAREIGQAMSGYTVVVDKSTVPAGTSELVSAVIRTKRHRSASSAILNS